MYFIFKLTYIIGFSRNANFFDQKIGTGLVLAYITVRHKLCT
jgi:hypothetical protein